MFHCPRCGSSKNVKNGIVNKKQRYNCKNCHTNFTVIYDDSEHQDRDFNIRPDTGFNERLAYYLHMEGYSLRKISILTQCSINKIVRFIKKLSQISHLRKSINKSETTWEYFKKNVENSSQMKRQFLVIDLCENSWGRNLSTIVRYQKPEEKRYCQEDKKNWDFDH